MTTLTPSTPVFIPKPSAINIAPISIASLVVIAGAIYLAQTVGIKQGALWVVGALLGVTLYFASFGFTQAWRVFIADRRGAGLRAQMAMLAVGVLLFFPFLRKAVYLVILQTDSSLPPGSLCCWAHLFLV